MTHVSTPEEALVASTLKHYDGLVLYANHETITPEQEQALVDFVEGGKAMVVIHCASFMFTKAPRYIPMVGGQFQQPRHRRVHRRDHRARSPGDEGPEAVHHLGRDLRPHAPQHRSIAPC